MLLRRRIVIIALFLIVIFAVAYGFIPKPALVDIARASLGPLKVTIEEEGKTRVKDRFVVSAPVAGYMRRIKLEVGGLVKKGETVVELEPRRLTPEAGQRQRPLFRQPNLGSAQQKKRRVLQKPKMNIPKRNWNGIKNYMMRDL